MEMPQMAHLCAGTSHFTHTIRVKNTHFCSVRIGRRNDEWADVGTHAVAQGDPVADCASNHTWEEETPAFCRGCGGEGGPNGHVVASWPAG